MNKMIFSCTSNKVYRDIRRTLCFKKKVFLPIVVIVVMFFLLTPAYFNQLDVIKYFFYIGKSCSLFLGILIFLKIFKEKKFGLFTFEVFLILLLLTFVTIFQQGDIIRSLKLLVVSISSISLIFYMFFKLKESFFVGLLCFFELLVLGNFLSVYFYPEGLYIFESDSGWWSRSVWFLGLRNGMSPFYIIAALLEFLYYERTQKCARVFVFLSIYSYTIYLINQAAFEMTNTSSGGLTVIWLFITFYFVFRKISKCSNFQKVVNVKNAVLINLVIFILLVFFNIQNFFSYIFENILHKNPTLTSRTEIWNHAIDCVFSSPFYGNGIEYGSDMASRLHNLGASETTQNGFLDVLYNGGCVSFALFCIIIFTVNRIVRKNINDVQIRFLFGYVSFCYCLAAQTESLIGPRFFMFLSFMLVISYQIKNDKCTLP